MLDINKETDITAQEIEMLAGDEMKLGEEAIVNQDFTSAILHIRQSLKYLKEIDNIEDYVKNLNILGLVYAMKEDENAAFECYLESLANAEVIKSKDLKALSYSNIGGCYQRMGRYQEAYEYYRNAKKEYKESKCKVEKNYEMWNTLNYLNQKGSGSEQMVKGDDAVIFV